MGNSLIKSAILWPCGPEKVGSGPDRLQHKLRIHSTSVHSVAPTLHLIDSIGVRRWAAEKSYERNPV